MRAFTVVPAAHQHRSATAGCVKSKSRLVTRPFATSPLHHQRTWAPVSRRALPDASFVSSRRLRRRRRRTRGGAACATTRQGRHDSSRDIRRKFPRRALPVEA
eukprot:Amastigsp_a1452_2.p1 type:complete len:103 gc:universal Amastigsp_a1452_2:3-311(+)